MKEMKYTGERLVPSLHSLHGVTEHLHRYALALELAKNKVVLDIASGEGYGSNLLSSVATYVYGVDIDSESIKHANHKYGKRNRLEYLEGSTSKIPIEDASIDLVVSFETLEHHDEHEQMMIEIKRVLKHDGVLLISSPEKTIYYTRDPNNPYHIMELTFLEFEKLLRKHFDETVFLTQRFVAGSLISINNPLTNSTLALYSGDYKNVLTTLSKQDFYNQPFFNLAICSNKMLNENSYSLNSFFDGAEVILNEIEKEREKVKVFSNTTTYRFAKKIVKFFSFLKLS